MFPGLSFLAIPVVAVTAFGSYAKGHAIDSNDPADFALLAKAATLAVNSLISALAVTMLFLTSIRLGATRTGALFAAGALAFATPFFGWSTTFFAHSVSGSLLMFVAAGIAFRRAVWWGLAFVLVWENVVTHTAEGAARFTVNGWASSVLGLAPDVDVSHQAGSAGAAFVVLVAIAVVGWLIATWRYRRADVD